MTTFLQIIMQDSCPLTHVLRHLNMTQHCLIRQHPAYQGSCPEKVRNLTTFSTQPKTYSRLGKLMYGIQVQSNAFQPVLRGGSSGGKLIDLGISILP
jgi:hypothetical protein